MKIDSADTTIVQGKVDVAAPAANARGGKVELLGERVGLLDGAKVDASGGAGGGTVLAGGDYLGGNAPAESLQGLVELEDEAVKNAKATVMADTAEIKADATVNGNGGKITVWSDEYTGFFGELFARGGAEGGNGGFIETSSKDNLQAFGSASASATKGQAGLWLLDPSNVTLSSATSSGGSFTSTDPSIFTTTANDAVANVGTINTSLNSGTSVTIQTGRTAGGQDGNITQAVGGVISKTAGAEATLTLLANGLVDLSQNITSTTGALNLTIKAGTTNNGDSGNLAAASVTLGSNLALNGGTLIIQNGGNGGIAQSAGTAITGASVVTIQGSTGDVTLNQSGNDFGTISATGAAVSIRDSNGFILGNSTFSQASTLQSGGSISQAGLLTVSAGGLTVILDTAGTDIDLSTAANSITGGVTLGGTQSNIRDLKLRNTVAAAAVPINFASATNLRDLTIFYDAAAFAIPDLVPVQATLRNISITANGGNITQVAGGGIVANGTATFSTTTGNITLTSAFNDFGDVVNASVSGNARSISLTDSNELQLGQIVVGGTGASNLTLTFDQNPVTNAGLTMSTTGRIQMNGAGGTLALVPTSPFTDILLGVNTANANSIAVLNGTAITITNPGNVRDLVLRNVNEQAAFATSLSTALSALTNLRDLSLNLPATVFTIPALNQASLRDVNVFALDITTGAISSQNGLISLSSVNAFTATGNVNTLSGRIDLKSDGDLTINDGVVIGSTTTGNITLSADADSDGAGDLSIGSAGGAGTIIGNAGNSAEYTLQGAALVFGAGNGLNSSVIQGNGTVIFVPSALDAVIVLGGGAGAFAVPAAALLRTFSAGTVRIGSSSQVGNIDVGNLTLVANTFQNLELTTSGAGVATLAANAILRTFGTNITFDTNLDLGLAPNTLLAIDTTQGGFFPAGGNISFLKAVDSDRTLAVANGRLSLTAGTGGDVLFSGTVGGINPVDYLQVTSADTVTINRVTARVGGLNGPGGLISLTGNTVTMNGVLNVDAITVAAGPGQSGGQVLVTGRDVVLNNRVTANGGDGVVNAAGANFGGGSAGEISIRATDTLSVNPTPDGTIGGSFTALGGDPSGGNAQFGADGIINLQSQRDLYFTVNQEAQRETQYSISAGRNLIFASFLDRDDFGESVGGVSFRMNVNNNQVIRVPLNLRFAQSDPTGILYMAPGSTIQMNGGRLAINEGQDLDTGRIELANIDIVNTPSFGLIYQGDSELRFSGSLLGSNTQGGSGATISISAPNASFVVEGGITVNGTDVLGSNAGAVSIRAGSIRIGEIQANGGGAGGTGGRGGNVTLTSVDGGIRVGTIYAQGGVEDDLRDGGFGGTGGSLVLSPGGPLGDGRTDSLDIQLIDVSGGASSSAVGVGGRGGNITITSTGGDLLVPANMYNGGGAGAQFRGAPGDIRISTTVADADIALGNSNIVINGNGNVVLSSAANLILGTVDFSLLDPLTAVNPGSLTINNGAVAGEIFGNLTMRYGTVSATGQLVMPTSSTLRSNGGSVTITGNGGQAQVGSILTFLSNAAGGAISIDVLPGATPANSLAIGGFLVTQGGDGAAGGGNVPGGAQGFAGGSVTLRAGSVTVGSIRTLGGNSDATALLIGSGGVGGNVSITATAAGGLITLTNDLIANGGNGLSTRDGFGGAGGRITLTTTATGGVVLDSGVSTLTQIILNSSGGDRLAAGSNGVGGAIVVNGGLGGTPTTSNNLSLVHGSGAVTLGSSSANLITLGTLITAADNEASTGAVTINGRLTLDTLTTFGRGYGISILGNGSQIAQNVTFLNTGVVALGSAGGTVTFAGGFDAASGATAPASVRLAGTIVSGPGTGAGMLMDTVFLDAATSLNSNNNAIQMGSIDGAFGLTLLSGIAGSSVEIGGVVGGTTRLGDINVQTGLTQVLFSQAVNAASFTTASGSSTTLEGNLNLSGAVNLGGTTVLRSVDEDASLAITTSGGTISGNLTLEESGGDGVSISSSGALGVSGGVSGAVNLALAGAGAKTFSGTVSVGSGSGASLAIGGGAVSFSGLTTAGGITSSSVLTFNNSVNLDTAGTGTTALAVAVTLGGVNFNAGGAVGMSGPVTLTGDSTLTGAGAYDITGTVTGAGRSLQLAGAGNKSFSNTVGLASISQTGSAATSFSGIVNLSDGAAFSGGVTLSGNTFTAVNRVDFAGLAVTGGTATVAGDALYNFAGAVTGSAVLAMSGTGTKTFASTVGTAGLQETGGGTVNLRGNVFTSSDSSFAGQVNLRGIAFTTGGLTQFNGRVTLETTGATLQGGGDFVVAGNMEGEGVGIQTLTLAQAGLKTFGGTVGDGMALKGIQQSGGTVAFNNTVRTRGNSTFGGAVELSGMTFDAQVANTSTRFNQGATLNGGAVALDGSGNFAFASDVVVGLDSALAMNAAAANQTFTFAGNLGSLGNLTSLTQTGGKMVVGSGSSSTVQTTGNVALANLSTRGAVTVDSGGSNQRFSVLGLGGNFTSAADGASVTYGTVSGSGNMNTTASQLELTGVVRNSGSFAAGQDDAVMLGAGGFLSDTDFANLLSSGGATFTSNLANVEVNDVQAQTGLTLVSRGGNVVVSGLTSRKSLGIQAFGTADLAGLTQVQSLRLLEAGQLGVDGLDNLDASGLGNITLNTGGLAYNRGNGAVSLQGLINAPGNIDIRAAGGVVNTSGRANPFRTDGSVVIVTRDLFNSSLQSALIPGGTLVNGPAPGLGIASVAGGTTIYYENVNNLLPYSSEFTTGTGQPYILATQENAVPAVVMPAAYTVAGAFPTRVRYSAEELEMMTPEERSAYEAGQRRESARVILERQPGQPEVGVPAEGEIPQAMAPEPAQPAPTAQVILDGKPLAGKSDKEKGDSSQLLRVRPAKAVALRLETNGQEVMENERLAAEVNVGSAPVAGR